MTESSEGNFIVSHMIARPLGLGSLFLVLVLIGAGCTSVPVSSLTPEQATAELGIAQGSQIVVRPTVLGIGGKIAKWLGGETGERVVTVDEWTPGVRAAISWSITTQVETAESLATRKAYDETYDKSPVGVEIPKPPKPTYQDEVEEGTIKTDSLESATTLWLPEQWPHGDGGTVQTTLLWLSRSQYDELVGTRQMTLSLDLFDEFLTQIQETTSRFRDVVNRLSAILPFGKQKEASEDVGAADDEESVLTMKASPSWGMYVLKVNGVRTTVRTIEAKNKFGSLSILANRDNPLVLEVRLTPLAQGRLDVLSGGGLAKGFGGYEVVEVEK